MLPWCRALYHRRSLGMIPVTAYRGVANWGPGALMNCPTFLPMGENLHEINLFECYVRQFLALVSQLRAL